MALHDLTPLLRHISPDEIPTDADLLDGSQLAAALSAFGESRFHLLAGGDVMLGGRARKVLFERGPDHAFLAVRPLMARADVVLANLEGPLARQAPREERNFAYRCSPSVAKALAHAGIHALTLANNHLLDCGRGGVFETMDSLRDAGVAWIGAGATVGEAHRPALLDASGLRIALLGYYWNRRTAATAMLPGSAMDTPESLAADIRHAKALADRVVATFHWGVPYQRTPSAEDRAKARLAIDLGADAVVGHHAHVVLPFEVYRGRPIFHGVGNFTFGSGNSKGEGLLVGLRFTDEATDACVYPLYVKNRDPRVAYQPKVLTGDAGRRVLERLAAISGEHGRRLLLRTTGATVHLPRREVPSP
jgi:poly-gamma-glutamate capsule biosynthesis protein CapA/YwtB (metallophosphatase superfamily)